MSAAKCNEIDVESDAQNGAKWNINGALNDSTATSVEELTLHASFLKCAAVYVGANQCPFIFSL